MLAAPRRRGASLDGAKESSFFAWIDRRGHDKETYQKYMAPNVGILQRFKASFLVRVGDTRALRCEQPDRIVFLGFPEFSVGRDWFHCDDYQRNRCVRQKASNNGSLFLFEGLEGASLEGSPAYVVKLQHGTGNWDAYEHYTHHLVTIAAASGGELIFSYSLPWRGRLAVLEGEAKVDAAVGFRFDSWEAAEGWSASVPTHSLIGGGGLETQVFLLEGTAAQ